MAAKRAARELGSASTAAKDAALEATARLLGERTAEILEANAADLADDRAAGLTQALRDRLTLTADRIAAMAEGVRAVSGLGDPIGEELEAKTLDSGLSLRKLRVPLGVVAVVYEARPNVTIDCAALTIKSGNAIVLRGSSYAERSNGALAGVVREALAEAGLPEGAVLLLASGDRDELAELATQEGNVDLLIPRGGEGLKNALKDVATVPVIFAAAGNCHVYVHADADLEMARRIALNAKTQRPGVCNAAETLLVDAAIAADFLPAALAELRDAGVELVGDERARGLAGGVEIGPASEADWDTEYLDLKLAVARRRLARGRDRPRQRPRHRPLRGDRHRLRGGLAALYRRRRCRCRLHQRLDSLHRRLRVRHGGGDRQLDPEAARARADRSARADDLQVRRPRRRPSA